MMKFDRVCLLVLDACGVGELPDADEYGDTGSNTIGNCAKAVGGLNLPNLGKLGLGNIIPIEGVPPMNSPAAYYGKMAEKSAGKDSTMGHWELAGLITETPFPLFPNGFPADFLEELSKSIGRGIIGNVAASGTEIIEWLGETHQKSGDIIVYTSADSVFQVAAHTDTVPLEELYIICIKARKMMTGELGVSRVIARPFIGRPGKYARTADRRDFSLEPPAYTMLDKLKESGFDVITVGKVDYLFAGRGVTESNHTRSNEEGADVMIKKLRSDFGGLLFVNLVDFDMLWGHRNDIAGFAAGLEYVDNRMPDIIGVLKYNDLLLITADHGCDPTTRSTDHSREFVPLIAFSKNFADKPDSLGIRHTFADLAATVCEIFELDDSTPGTSFYEELK